jgi:ATP-dependent helicase/nuclease subunit B
VRSAYPWLADGARAEAARASEEFTVYDGRIPGGTPELDPRAGAGPMSASRIEALAKCPFSYFLRHVLRIEPPREVSREPMQWLDARDRGSLLHDVFREFFERLARDREKPDVARHGGVLEEIARRAIAAWSERIPPRSRVAFDDQERDILFTCRTLLAREAEHCRGVTPRFFEIPFGVDRPRADPPSPIASRDPVRLALDGGASFLLRGSIDRADEAPDGSFHVWDYKTGWALGYVETAGARGGRQIQPALYGMALDALLDAAGISGRVSRSGYFFPGWKGEGQRIAPRADPSETRDVLGRLFDLLRDGLFPHAASEDDCRYCDFESICGGARSAAERSDAKLAASDLLALARFREIHAE